MNILRSKNSNLQLLLMCSGMRQNHKHIKSMQNTKFVKIVIITTNITFVEQKFARPPLGSLKKKILATDTVLQE